MKKYNPIKKFLKRGSLFILLMLSTKLIEAAGCALYAGSSIGAAPSSLSFPWSEACIANGGEIKDYVTNARCTAYLKFYWWHDLLNEGLREVYPTYESCLGGYSITVSVTDSCKGGNACGNDDPDVMQCNPVNVATGNKFQVEQDFSSQQPNSLEFKRFYNSSESFGEVLGRQWLHNYQRTIVNDYGVQNDEDHWLFSESDFESSGFPRPESACASGWNELKAILPGLPNAPSTVEFTGNSCQVSFGGASSKSISINVKYHKRANSFPALVLPPPQSLSIGMLAVRHTGEVIRFEKINDKWVSPGSGVSLQLTENGAVFTSREGEIEIYDAMGNLIEIRHMSGNKQTLAYSDKGLLISVTDEGGRSLGFEYNNDGQMVAMTDPVGHMYHYSYDVKGNLSTVTYPDETPVVSHDNPKRVYHYEDNQHPEALTGITDERGVRYATWAYDSEGRATLSRHADGANTGTFTYNSDGSTTLTNALGRKATFKFVSANGAKRISSVEGQATTLCSATSKNYTYDAVGHKTSSTDWNGNITNYSYNDRDLVVSRTEAVGSLNERTITTKWHDQWNLPVQITEPSRITTMTYNDKGQLLSRQVTPNTQN
jgi:YD repeat-containing protein